MQGPVPLKLAEITLRRLLIVNLKLPAAGAAVFGEPITELPVAQPDLHLPELLGGEAQGELVAAALVLEAVDAAKGLGDGDVEEEVGEGEEGDGDPAVAALEARGLGQALRVEGEAEEDEEEEEVLVELLLLEVYGSFFLQGFLEVELDDCVYGL